MNVVYLHGALGMPTENWAAWLGEKVKQAGHTFTALQFPLPPNHTLTEWKSVWDKAGIVLNEKTILVGHSLGVAFGLRLLEESTSAIRGCIFAAGFAGLLENQTFDMLNKSFVEKEFSWNTIKQRAGNIVLLHGDDDPYVPLSRALQLRSALGAELRIIRDGGHLNARAGYRRLPQAWDALQEILEDKK